MKKPKRRPAKDSGTWYAVRWDKGEERNYWLTSPISICSSFKQAKLFRNRGAALHDAEEFFAGGYGGKFTIVPVRVTPLKSVKRNKHRTR